MAKVEREAADRNKPKAKAAKKKKAAARAASTAPTAGSANLISLQMPESANRGGNLTVKIPHTLPAALGEQILQVTLKAGEDGRRVERKIVKVSGSGIAEVTFAVPQSLSGESVTVAAFVGEEFAANLQHLNSKPVLLR